VSELRAIELLEDICQKMNSYTLDAENGKWVKGLSGNSSSNVLKEHRRVLRNICSDIIGEWEDDIAEKIKTGEATSTSIRQILCVELSQVCPKDNITHDDDDDASVQNDEL